MSQVLVAAFGTPALAFLIHLIGREIAAAFNEAF